MNHSEINKYVNRLSQDPDPKYLHKIKINLWGEVLLLLNKQVRKRLLKHITDDEFIEACRYLSPDEITDLLQSVPKKRQDILLKRLQKDIRDKVEFLLRFDPDSAAGLMSLDYVEIPVDSTFSEVSERIKIHEKRTGKIPVVLVVDNGYLKGELPVSSLVFHEPNEKIGGYIIHVPVIKYNANREQMLNLFRRHKHNKVVVLDEDNSIIGVIYSDDLLRFLGELSTNSLYEFAGVSEEEDVLDSPVSKVKNRYKWLLINLGTEFLAASVVALFQKTIQAYVLLAVYMPIVAGMGGNAGTQTLAVMVRGMAQGRVRDDTWKRIFRNEMIAGLLNGGITGLVVGMVAWVLTHDIRLSVVIGLALIINLLVAGLSGTLIPLILKRMGKDPASSATVFITTATDVFGFLAFLGLATIVLG